MIRYQNLIGKTATSLAITSYPPKAAKFIPSPEVIVSGTPGTFLTISWEIHDASCVDVGFCVENPDYPVDAQE